MKNRLFRTSVFGNNILIKVLVYCGHQVNISVTTKLLLMSLWLLLRTANIRCSTVVQTGSLDCNPALCHCLPPLSTYRCHLISLFQANTLPKFFRRVFFKTVLNYTHNSTSQVRCSRNKLSPVTCTDRPSMFLVLALIVYLCHGESGIPELLHPHTKFPKILYPRTQFTSESCTEVQYSRSRLSIPRRIP